MHEGVYASLLKDIIKNPLPPSKGIFADTPIRTQKIAHLFVTDIRNHVTEYRFLWAFIFFILGNGTDKCRKAGGQQIFGRNCFNFQRKFNFSTDSYPPLHFFFQQFSVNTGRIV
jgi:hypothetical protein